jgi:hypothetical protein
MKAEFDGIKFILKAHCADPFWRQPSVYMIVQMALDGYRAFPGSSVKRHQ